MKKVYVTYVLCEDAKEVDLLQRICSIYGAHATFSCNQKVGKGYKDLYEILAFSKKDMENIEKEIEA